MLNSEIKRKIDNARDILVGKIPVPSQQIEQITIALIYKFMSDIDLQDKELGGEGFFQGEFEKYSWNNIMDRKIGGQERLNLYSEGLDKMGTNPHLPQMFRDIFRNAYLPFKDPSTLDLFLKQIDEFSYDHSEDLGDAFEYLLSTAGSQGDAGQFRTPRHIIDFIVSIVQPQFTDTVLDPACGTAGFLISAYKYIMNQNKDKVAGDKLSLVQKKELTQHFVGYDISYEMVRLSLVNMYLHNFGDPKIYEYDTLSNDDRWDDRFDCILANPPFMTPKGGIQPHNRFSIKASKSEVLFVDYMIEHLNPHGKAGIVVPEGIIFQSGKAYKSLREKMVNDNYLWAVVSLPSGVFQPYSGVKTSILLFDQELAKKTDNILFVKVQNDGFDLGAQRKPSSKNDLPKATEILLQYKKDLLAGNEIKIENSDTILLVSKEKIEENSEFNLSMDRYKGGNIPVNTNFELVKLGDICEVLDNMRKPVSKGERKNGIYPYYGASGIVDYVDDYIFDEKAVLIGEDGAKWGAGEQTAFIASGKYWVNNHCHILRPNRNIIYDELLVYMLNKMDLTGLVSGGVIPKLTQKDLRNIEIPLPPLEVQEKIVAELDSYQKVIDGAKMIVDNYKPTIKINPDWEMVKLGDVCDLQNGYAFKSDDYIEKSNTLNFRMSNIRPGGYVDIEYSKKYLPDDYAEMYKDFLLNDGDVVIAMTDMASDPKILAVPCIVKTEGYKLLLNQRVGKFDNIDYNRINKGYMQIILNQDFIRNSLAALGGGGVQINISKKDILGKDIPLPSLEEQNQIVAEIEKEEAMVENAKQLIEVFEKKIKDRIDEIWGK